MTQVSPSQLSGLLGHLIRWLSNLRRAGEQRKRQSVTALRDVILAVRETTVYLRTVHETGRKNLTTEKELARLWTELAFQMEDLGLGKLAKRCDISGQQWADPKRFNEDFLNKADVSLESIERLARLTLREINA